MRILISLGECGQGKTKVAFMENQLQDFVFLKPLFQVRTPLGWWIVVKHSKI